MVLLGLILVALGLVVGVIAYLGAAGQSQTIELTAVGWTRAFSVLELLIIGAVAVLLVWLGWAAISSTLRRRARARREERERERYAELERTHADYVTESERRLEEGHLRDEDFARREEQIRNRQAEIELREDEIARREAARRDNRGPGRPTVADVVTGRAEGRVSEGTAQWVQDDTAVHQHGSTAPGPTARGDGPRVAGSNEPGLDEPRTDEPTDGTWADVSGANATVPRDNRPADTGPRPDEGRTDRA